MRLASLIAPALLIAVSAPALADAPTPAASPLPKPEKPKKTCRSEAVTGSIMRKQTCHTAAEWAEIDAQNAANAERSIDSRPRGTPNSSF